MHSRIAKIARSRSRIGSEPRGLASDLAIRERTSETTYLPAAAFCCGLHENKILVVAGVIAIRPPSIAWICPARNAGPKRPVGCTIDVCRDAKTEILAE